MNSADFTNDALHHVGLHAQIALLILCCALGNRLLLLLRGSIHHFDVRVLTIVMSTLILLACLRILGDELSDCVRSLHHRMNFSVATLSMGNDGTPGFNGHSTKVNGASPAAEGVTSRAAGKSRV